MTDWTRLEQLNEGNPIIHSTPLLDTPAEVWFYNADYEPRVWRDGALERHVPEALTLDGAVQQRVTLYHRLRGLFVDVEQRADRLLVRRGVLNGKWIAIQQAASELDALRARYAALGFLEVSPWHASSNHVTKRQYVKDAGTLAIQGWQVVVDGTTVIADREKRPAADRQAAVAMAEERIAAQEAAGFTLQLIELMTADFPNPPPVHASVVADALDGLLEQAEPDDPLDAVDAAVDLLKALHARLPQVMFIAECLEGVTQEARIDELGEDAEFFLSMHEQRIGRWNDLPQAPSRDEDDGESSWSYFARVYASITWIVASPADEGLPTFYCGNVSGGGWSCMEIDGEGTYDINDLMAATDNDDLEYLFVFHGGWHNDRSWAFDQRGETPAGDEAIIPFDESMTELPPETPLDEIVPFGHWLHRQVVTLGKAMARNVRDLGL